LTSESQGRRHSVHDYRFPPRFDHHYWDTSGRAWSKESAAPVCIEEVRGAKGSANASGGKRRPYSFGMVCECCSAHCRRREFRNCCKIPMTFRKPGSLLLGNLTILIWFRFSGMTISFSRCNLALDASTTYVA
jgi:hypothetical protein